MVCIIHIPDTEVAITLKLVDVEALEGESATYTCEVSNENVPVSWFKDGRHIHPSKKYDITSQGKVHSLVVHDLTIEDEADYTAVAGNQETTAYLYVDGKKIMYILFLSLFELFQFFLQILNKYKFV